MNGSKYYILNSVPTQAILDDCVENSVDDCKQNNTDPVTKWVVKTPDGVTEIPDSLAGETQQDHAYIINELENAEWQDPDGP